MEEREQADVVRQQSNNFLAYQDTSSIGSPDRIFLRRRSSLLANTRNLDKWAEERDDIEMLEDIEPESAKLHHIMDVQIDDEDEESSGENQSIQRRPNNFNLFLGPPEPREDLESQLGEDLRTARDPGASRPKTDRISEKYEDGDWVKMLRKNKSKQKWFL